MFRLFTFALFVTLTAACSNVPTEPVEQQRVAVVPEPDSKLERHIPPDSIYPLLVAEFALRRRHYDVALNHYLEQSALLRDPAVSAHATHLAQFTQNEDAAMEALALWLEVEPDNVEANGTMATLLARKRRTLEAIPYLQLVARSGTPVHYPILLNGFDKLSPSEQAQLVTAIDGLAVEFPQEPGIMMSQAIIHNEFKRYDQALEKLRRILETDPHQTQALVFEARILLELDAKSPLRRIEQVLEARPNDSKLRLQYAQLLTQSSMTAARQQFEILSSQSPGNGDVLFSLALINRETGNTAQAKTYLRQMLEQSLRTGEAHYYLGRILQEEGELQAAVTHYMQVEDGRDFLSANSRIGAILLATQRQGENHTYLNDLRGQYPQRKEQLYGLEIEMLSRAGELDDAMNVANMALHEMPESTTLRYTRSMLGEAQNDLVLMERDLRGIILQDPDNATALNALGYTLANRTERYSEAFSLISRALALQPEEPAILDSMGWVLYRQGKFQQAVEYLSRAYAKFPDPEVAAHLGEVLWVSGDTTSAQAVLQGAFEQNPNHALLVETLERLGIPQPPRVQP